ncbi:response regulator [Amycolatopsis sp. NBC_01488]|uniref:response regulator n=1 Tax=Amycolatopsis sp. NBC_01488 TaxID=2903563 RepID=UPI002E2B59B5|nr:response regulator [Amycolatopsis sp. NBC_01488]
MIRTLIVDDDYRIAKAHASSIRRIEPFVPVGEAHSLAEARAMVRTTHPDLLLLDLYLPDGNGLDLISGLRGDHHQPDFIVITAARDIDSVRRAIRLGAVYYLVKPFGFAQLREELTAYQRLRDGLSEADVANQETVDALYGLLRGPAKRAGERRLPTTMAQVLTTVRESVEPLSATGVAERLGISRATAQRYLADLVRRGLADLSLNYGTAGRPEHRYHATT